MLCSPTARCGLGETTPSANSATARRVEGLEIRTPAKVNINGIAAISAGPEDGYALGTDGKVWAWGDNTMSQLGYGSARNPSISTVPVQVSGLGDVIAITAGGTAAYALRSDGTVWAWGSDYWGQLGDGNDHNSAGTATPTEVSGLDHIIAIAASESNAFALRSDGTVWAWADPMSRKRN